MLVIKKLIFIRHVLYLRRLLFFSTGQQTRLFCGTIFQAILAITIIINSIQYLNCREVLIQMFLILINNTGIVKLTTFE